MDNATSSRRVHHRALALKMHLEEMNNFQIDMLAVQVFLMTNHFLARIIFVVLLLLSLGVIVALSQNNAQLALLMGIWIGLLIALLFFVIRSNR